MIIVVVIIVGLSAIIAIFSISAASIVCSIGCLNVFERHLDRCRYCGSWRVKIWQDRYPDEMTPGWTVVTDFRACKNKRCRIQVINHCLLQEPNPFRL